MKTERFAQHEAFAREPPDFATPSAIQAQIEAFLARGGVIQTIPIGTAAHDAKVALRPDRKPRGIATDQYSSSRGRKSNRSQQFKLKGSMRD